MQSDWREGRGERLQMSASSERGGGEKEFVLAPRPLISLPLFTMFLMQLSPPPPPPQPLVGQKPLRISPQLGGGNKGLDAALAYTLFFYASFLFVGWIRGKTVVVTS